MKLSHCSYVVLQPDGVELLEKCNFKKTIRSRLNGFKLLIIAKSRWKINIGMKWILNELFHFISMLAYNEKKINGDHVQVFSTPFA